MCDSVEVYASYAAEVESAAQKLINVMDRGTRSNINPEIENITLAQIRSLRNALAQLNAKLITFGVKLSV